MQLDCPMLFHNSIGLMLSLGNIPLFAAINVPIAERLERTVKQTNKIQINYCLPNPNLDVKKYLYDLFLVGTYIVIQIQSATCLGRLFIKPKILGKH